MDVRKIDNIELLIELRFAFLSEQNAISETEWVSLKEQLYPYFEKHLIQKDFTAFGLYIHEQVVSCAFLVIEEYPPSPFFPNGIAGTILNVYTFPEFRHKGYAEAVMKAVIKEAQKHKVSVLTLASTEAGKRLYEKLGFKGSHYTHMQYALL